MWASRSATPAHCGIEGQADPHAFHWRDLAVQYLRRYAVCRQPTAQHASRLGAVVEKMDCCGFVGHQKVGVTFDSLDKGHALDIDQFADAILKAPGRSNGLVKAARAAVISYKLNESIERRAPVAAYWTRWFSCSTSAAQGSTGRWAGRSGTGGTTGIGGAPQPFRVPLNLSAHRSSSSESIILIR